MKDAKGHGSNSHEVIDTHNADKVMSQHPTFRKAFNAASKGEPSEMPAGGWRFQVRPISGNSSGGQPVTSNASAAAQLASGPKSAPTPTHDAMISNGNGVGYNEHGSRHGYNPESVNSAIAASNRGGQRISGKQASAIHRLLKGR